FRAPRGPADSRCPRGRTNRRHVMRNSYVWIASLIAVTAASAAWADDTANPVSNPGLIRPFVGAYIPTGKQSDVLKSSVLTGLQLGYQLPSPLRVVGSIGWTPSEAKDFSDVRTNILQYDVGAEVGPRSVSEDVWKFGPFAGLGLGARTYKFHDVSASDQTD